jgi:hypothetical protein
MWMPSHVPSDVGNLYETFYILYHEIMLYTCIIARGKADDTL